MDTTNPQLHLAEKYISETGCNVFLTGRAGTGKTTFLQSLGNTCSKRMVIAAPTGVAAINAGGITLHSLFQLPFGPMIPGSTRAGAHFRFSKEKKKIIKSMDLLVIDEISMVRADLLDGVDDVLRRLRRSNLPFGGVQLLMIGDLFQLPPVVKPQDWQQLGRHYSTPYFFSSKALAHTELVTIELERIYRQSDTHFINILNKVRTNTLDPATFTELNKRVNPNFSAEENKGYITLCSHNDRANAINRGQLENLPEKIHLFDAIIEGDFPDHTYPTDSTLHLKKGAQVMFIRNDSSPEKRYFNGKIGTITSISKDVISVKCPEDLEEIGVEPSIWENIEYRLNDETQEITEKKIGAFQQYPLRLAWAITIHKSQGLTFDKAIIDAEAAFAHGQVYVALSRCRSLEGMVLATPLSGKSLQIDRDILQFNRETQNNTPSKTHLQKATGNYQRRLLLECFDFQNLRSLLNRLAAMVTGSHDLLRISGIKDLAELKNSAEQQIFTISANFQRQLYSLFTDSIVPAEDERICERIGKASSYFQEKIQTILVSNVDSIELETDNKELGKKTNNILKFLKEEIQIKLAAVVSCSNGFSPTDYFRAISAAALQSQKTAAKKPAATTGTYTESDIVHPELFQILKEWRTKKAKTEDIAAFMVLHQKTLIQLVVQLPETIEKFEQIKGIGKKLSERYGSELVAIISKYRRDHQIETVILPPPATAEVVPSPPQKSKKNTRQHTLELFEQGLTIAEIAKERQLTETTIETHLAHHIERGKVAAAALLPQKRLEMLADRLKHSKETSLKAIKDTLDIEVTYSEICIVLAHLKHLSSLGEG
jgi:hypothetical protein